VKCSKYLCLLALALLSGCAAPSLESSAHQESSSTASEMLTGRLSVVVAGDAADPSNPSAAQSISALFELQGSAQKGSLNLISPLGSVMAQARWSPEQALLITSKGQHRYPDMVDLTRDLLGESLPVEALFDWLRGQPWAPASSTASAAPAPSGFTQLGWRIDISRLAQSIIVAERERAPKVTLRARLDKP
jgi:outer membrane lipoprotein LolB